MTVVTKKAVKQMHVAFTNTPLTNIDLTMCELCREIYQINSACWPLTFLLEGSNCDTVGTVLDKTMGSMMVTNQKKLSSFYAAVT